MPTLSTVEGFGNLDTEALLIAPRTRGSSRCRGHLEFTDDPVGFPAGDPGWRSHWWYGHS